MECSIVKGTMEEFIRLGEGEIVSNRNDHFLVNNNFKYLCGSSELKDDCQKR